MTQLSNPLASAIQVWPKPAQNQFHAIRAIVQDAAKTAEIGALSETLKWGQPSWMPQKSGIGSTLRVAWSDKHPDEIGLFVNCNSTLSEQIRTLYPASFRYQGNRALYLGLSAPLPEQAIHHCAHLTLTYHRTKA
ncbi:hypothetical protein [Pseudosulfitobacter sp. SM2401]|uniref:hypothetical protein n=1 Tax=Pseudosulfitobacter sp. SM2401 TaxID=3350098 RepID=UPI0036F1EF6A